MREIDKLFNNRCEWLRRNNRDMVVIVCGNEGAGKSTFALKICSMASPLFSANNVLYGYEEFANFLDTSPPNQSIQIDESGDFLLARESMAKERRDFLKRMMKVRSANHFLVFVISDLTLLEKYIKSFRASMLCKVVNKYDSKTGDAIRGIVEIYSKKRMKHLPKDSASGSILWHKVRPNIVERFGAVRGELWDKYWAKRIKYSDRQKKIKQVRSEDVVASLVTEYPNASRAKITELVAKKRKVSASMAGIDVRKAIELGRVVSINRRRLRIPAIPV
jgi:ABC-type cobalamin/Fe3+-siderophores transport system ATPase subunit